MTKPNLMPYEPTPTNKPKRNRRSKEDKAADMAKAIAYEQAELAKLAKGLTRPPVPTRIRHPLTREPT